MRPILLATLIMITILLFMNFAVGKEKTKSEWLNKNPCMIKVVITNTEINGITTTTKEEKLECKDGYDGPNYWELFAQFYYRETTTPEYCRYYTRPEHALRSFGKMCLKINGEWEVE